MTISLKHAFTSAKGDPGDTTLVRPSNWNAEHTLTLATDKLLGRTSASTGAVEEVTCTDAAQALIACADLDAIKAYLGIESVFTTGDIKPTLKTTADSGWIMCDDGTIGDASSAATTLASATAEDLFTLLWTNVSDTYAPVTTGRGASAAADWAAHKKIALTKMLGRALAAAGAGSGLTSRALGLTAGEETHVLTEAELAAHNHSVTDPGHNHVLQINGSGSSNSVSVGYPTGAAPFSGGNPQSTTATLSILSATTGVTVDDAGSDTAHNNVQPTSFVNFMIKL